MNQSNNVERYAASWVFPYLQSQMPEGYTVRPVPNNIHSQHRYGDKWIASRNHRHAIEAELKAEEQHTGNLFIETWSDLRNGVPGWLYHYADPTRLCYAFNDLHRLYTCSMGALRAWAQSAGFSSMLRIEDFPAREQRKYEQKNVTVGRLVPCEVFLCEVAGARSHDVQEVTSGR